MYKKIILLSFATLFLSTQFNVHAIHKDRNFRRCLNQHFDGKDLNERGFPRQCESPERRLSQWNRERSIATLERFKANQSRSVSQF